MKKLVLHHEEGYVETWPDSILPQQDRYEGRDQLSGRTIVYERIGTDEEGRRVFKREKLAKSDKY